MSLRSEALPEVATELPDAPVLHLDQSAWVGLARAGNGKEIRFLPLRNRLATLVDEERLVVCLSSGNYLELWNRQGRNSRVALARTMAEISRYATLAPLDALVRADFDQKLPVGLKRTNPMSALGIGADHAFDSETGRLRMVESLATDNAEEGPAVAPTADFVQLKRDLPTAVWEWFNLVGGDDSYDVPGIDYRPEHRLGDAFAQDHNAGIKAPVDASVTYRRIAGYTLSWMHDEILDEEHLDALRQLASPAAAIAFVNSSGPTAAFTELLYRTYRNKAYVFKQHDRSDLLSLSQALPHCNAVWADKHWANTARAAKLDSHFGTRIVSDPESLLDWLDVVKHR